MGKAGDKGQIVAESGDRPRETLKNKAFVGPVPGKGGEESGGIVAHEPHQDGRKRQDPLLVTLL